MMTHFHDFVRDNGLPVTVEYAVEGSYSPTTYSPMYGTDGGDAPTFCIIKAWPNTPWHNRLAKVDLQLWLHRKPRVRDLWRVAAKACVNALMRFDEWLRASLTVAECERFEAYLAEHHVEEDYQPDWDR